MRTFAEIYRDAAGLKGGEAEIEAQLPQPLPLAELAAIGDDRWLADMTKRVFQAGFNWAVIENKWEGFEAAFEGFDPHRCAMLSDDDLDRLASDARIVRNPQKIRTVRDNAQLLVTLAAKHGSAARAFAEWPSSDFVGLLEMLNKEGSRLGGSTAQFFLRAMGKDSFMLRHDVTTALIREGVVAKAPSSKSAMRAVQGAFNDWMAESDRPLMQISKVLALTVPSEPSDRTYMTL